MDTIKKAKELRDNLIKDVDSIPPEELKNQDKKMLEWVEKMEDPAVKKFCLEEYNMHKYRYFHTIKWLRSIKLGNEKQKTILELGGRTFLSRFIHEHFPGIRWINSKGDLRKKWKLPDNSIDLLICTEVMEHLNDAYNSENKRIFLSKDHPGLHITEMNLKKQLFNTTKKFNNLFFYTGVFTVMEEMRRVLKPGGRLFLTTPNGSSAASIHKILSGELPMIYLPHVREHTYSDIKFMLENYNFEINEMSTLNCLKEEKTDHYTQIFKMLIDSEYPVENRGHFTFALAKKK